MLFSGSLGTCCYSCCFGIMDKPFVSYIWLEDNFQSPPVGWFSRAGLKFGPLCPLLSQAIFLLCGYIYGSFLSISFPNVLTTNFAFAPYDYSFLLVALQCPVLSKYTFCFSSLFSVCEWFFLALVFISNCYIIANFSFHLSVFCGVCMRGHEKDNFGVLYFLNISLMKSMHNFCGLAKPQQ